MVHFVFIFVGAILIGVGSLIYFLSIGDPNELIGQIVAGGIGGLGMLFAIGGIRGRIKGSKQAKENLLIIQTGTSAEGTVTFVDKNYSFLVNQRPVYSIIEYISGKFFYDL